MDIVVASSSGLPASHTDHRGSTMHQRHVAAGLVVAVGLSLTAISVVTQEPAPSAVQDDDGAWAFGQTNCTDSDNPREAALSALGS